MRRLIFLALIAGCGTPKTGPDLVRERSLEQALRDGVAYLLSRQESDGSWGTGRHTTPWDLADSVPGAHEAFREATTALCVLALHESGLDDVAWKRGVDYLVERSISRRSTVFEIYNIWAHIYSIQALSIAFRETGDGRVKRAVEGQLDLLRRYETYMGGWNYYDTGPGAQRPSGEPTSFTTAAGLVALWEARRAGISVPQRTIDRAIRRVLEMRKPDGSYVYGHEGVWYPNVVFNKMQGAIGRTQAANFALWLWERPEVGEKEARQGMEAFFRHHKFIEIGRKRQYPHEAWFGTAPYYFFFGHYYAGRILERLPPADRARFAKPLAEKVLPFQEEDGSWWDYPMYDYHEPYGTSFAVMMLLRCRD